MAIDLTVHQTLLDIMDDILSKLIEEHRAKKALECQDLLQKWGYPQSYTSNHITLNNPYTGLTSSSVEYLIPSDAELELGYPETLLERRKRLLKRIK